jgi:hypothetical protein
MFREGESEEYNSEVDGDISIDVGINFDILGVRESQSKVHQPLLAFIMHHEELPDDFESLLTYKRHRQNHQRKADEEWKKRIEEMGGLDPENEDQE